MKISDSKNKLDIIMKQSRVDEKGYLGVLEMSVFAYLLSVWCWLVTLREVGEPDLNSRDNRNFNCSRVLKSVLAMSAKGRNIQLGCYSIKAVEKLYSRILLVSLLKRSKFLPAFWVVYRLEASPTLSFCCVSPWFCWFLSFYCVNASYPIMVQGYLYYSLFIATIDDRSSKCFRLQH